MRKKKSMPKEQPCGSTGCRVSTGIHEGLTFGSGTLDFNGFWEKPCAVCARAHEKKYPESAPCWPFDTKGDDMNSPVKFAQSNSPSICPKQDIDESIRSVEQFNTGTKYSAD